MGASMRYPGECHLMPSEYWFSYFAERKKEENNYLYSTLQHRDTISRIQLLQVWKESSQVHGHLTL